MTKLCSCLAALILCSIPAFAQTAEVHARPLTDNDIKLLRQDLQASKDKIVTDNMEFTSAEKNAFWPVYSEYTREQHNIADKRFRLIMEYAQNLDKMEDAKAASLIDRQLQIESELQNLRKQYFPKFVQAIGAKRAAKFYQIDNRLTMMTDLQLTTEIPLIP